MNITISKYISTFLAVGLLLIFAGCGDTDYNSGMYWLNKEKNPAMAARSFQRSLAKRPGHWKTNIMALKALAQSDNAPEYEKQLRSTLQRWPDSTRSEAIYRSGVSLLGEEKYDRLSAPIAQRHFENLLGKKGDRPEIFCNIVMASCRMKDTVAATDYFRRLLGSLEGGNAPDSVTQELGFLIGPAGVEWVQLDWKVSKNPDDIDMRLAQLNAGLIVGDSASTRAKLAELAARLPGAVSDPEIVRRFGRLVGVDPFAAKIIAKGWDGSYSRDGKQIVYIRDRGKSGEPDQYIYTATCSGGRAAPIMKGLQQSLPSLAWPLLSPDGRYVYFYGSPNRDWSPDRSIGRFHLYRVRTRYGSRPQRLTDAELLPAKPHFESDGSMLVVKRDVCSTRASVEVARLVPDKRELTTVSRIGEPVSGSTFTPNGDSLIFTTDRGIFRRSVNGGNITVDLARRGLFFPQISPDGKWLLVLNRQNQALLIKRSSGDIYFIGRTAKVSGGFNTNGRLLLSQVLQGQYHLVELNLSREIKSTDEFQAAVR
ncbi:MAG TPA: hypothetical protein ENL08_00045 [Bacteroidetes bacterium]|nr:hypothetical protein [Bacteroidota bacterium]